MKPSSNGQHLTGLPAACAYGTLNLVRMTRWELFQQRPGLWPGRFSFGGYASTGFDFHQAKATREAA